MPRRPIDSLVLALVFAIALATPAPGAEPGDPRVGFHEVHGARLHVEIVGSGPPLLFLHGGLLFFENCCASQRDAFAPDHTVIGIDQRGHGYSPDTAGPFSYQQMADDTAAVLEQLHFGPVDVVGHSDGGNVGLLLARDHPELVRRLVVSGANLRAGLPADELRRRSAWSDEQFAAKAREITASLPAFFRPDYERVSPDGAGHWLTLVAKAYRLWLTPVVIEPRDLQRIRIPVLVMAGDHDFTSIEETTEIFRGLPAGQLVILPATGHATFMQRGPLANLVIREFLEAPDAAAPHPAAGEPAASHSR